MKLISLNIEGHKHLEARVIPFIQAEQPDVLCLQEVFYADISHFVEQTGMQFVQFLPLADVIEGNRHIPDELGWWGLAQFVKPGLVKVQPQPVFYYRHSNGEPILTTEKSLEQLRIEWQSHPVPKFMGDLDPNAAQKAIISMVVTSATEAHFNIMTTHFTWSAGGASTPEQLEHANTILSHLSEKTTNMIFCGDFNAPRGGKTFQCFAERWIDNIPKRYTTSLDQNLHKGGKLELMVDGLFSDPEVKFSSVRLQDAVSDHMAIVAEVV